MLINGKQKRRFYKYQAKKQISTSIEHSSIIFKLTKDPAQINDTIISIIKEFMIITVIISNILLNDKILDIL